jgi:hypothetical protein
MPGRILLRNVYGWFERMLPRHVSADHGAAVQQ